MEHKLRVGSLVMLAGNRVALVVRMKSTGAPGWIRSEGCSDKYIDVYLLKDKYVGWLPRCECEVLVP